MNKSKRLHGILIGVLILMGVGLLASAYSANAILSDTSHKLVGLKAEKAAAEEQEVQLAKAKKDIKTYSELNEIAKSVVPQDKDQAKTVSEIATLAAQSGISRLSSITFQPTTLGSTSTKKVKTPNGITQVTPVKGMAGVYDLQITVAQSPEDAVPYSSMITFLSKLENNRRTAQVSSINISPNSDQPELVSFTLVINEFIKP